MALRPLSQTGFPRIPQNASQRRILEGGIPAQRTVLDSFNDGQTERFLHPTKGWRRISARRSVAAMITAEMRRGRRWSTAAIGAAIRGVPR